MYLDSRLLTIFTLLNVASAAPIDVEIVERDIVDRQLPPGIPGFPIPTGLPGGGSGFPGFPGSPLPTGLPGGGGGFPGFPLPTGLPGGGGGFPSIPGFPLPTGLPGSGGGFPGFPGLPGGGGSSTENGVTGGGACTPLTVIFARGTSEAGNVGSVAGPPMFSALRQALGQDKVTVQGVDYPASAAGNANLGADGGPTMAKLAQEAISKCPDTKLALSGYSQGAMVVHNAAGQAGFPAQSVSSIVLFGDPFNGQAIQGVDKAKVLEICAQGDTLCSGGGFGITPAHLTYGNNAGQAADFVEKAMG